MTADRSIRASDRDRDSAAELLSQAFAVGRLSREELEERAAAVYSAKTWGELRDLTADLSPPAARTGFPSDVVASRPRPRRADRDLIRLMIWGVVLPLWGGLAGFGSPAAAWMIALVISVVLLLTSARRG